jgi:hypothetical protein
MNAEVSTRPAESAVQRETHETPETTLNRELPADDPIEIRSRVLEICEERPRALEFALPGQW